MRTNNKHRFLFVGLLLPFVAAADDEQKWDVDDIPGEARSVAIDTREGTWMSLDVSPDGRTIAFDLLGDIYTVPADEGTSRCLTAHSYDTREKNPAWSPDGRWIAFLSDRTGEEEVYLVDQKGDAEWVQVTSGGFARRFQASSAT